MSAGADSSSGPDRRRALANELEALEKRLETLERGAWPGPSSAASAPGGAPDALASLGSAVAGATKERIEVVRAALERFDRGTEGECETCGGPIAAGRLDAEPWTVRCAACADDGTA